VARGDEAGALALARSLAMTTYRSDLEFEERFAGPPEFDGAGPRFPVEDYLEHTGAAFAHRSSARAFLCLSQSLDLHDMDPASIRIPLTLVSIHPDAIAPRWQLERLAARVSGPCRLVCVDSPRGHDAFLTDHDAFASVITDFLAAPEIGA
jgi:homoserine O-acetyltransferase